MKSPVLPVAYTVVQVARIQVSMWHRRLGMASSYDSAAAKIVSPKPVVRWIFMVWSKYGTV